jgi:hypothetical protein
MGEFTAVLIGLIALCLLVSLIYARKTSSSVELFDPRPADYAFTIWAEQSAGFDPAGSADATRPQRITAEYLVRLQADSAEELEEAQVEFIRRTNASAEPGVRAPGLRRRRSSGVSLPTRVPSFYRLEGLPRFACRRSLAL